MKIIWISPVVPFPLDGGDKIRIFHLIREASTKHVIHLACLGREDNIGPELKSICADVKVFRPDLSKRTAQMISLLTGSSSIILMNRSAAMKEWLKNSAPGFDAAVIEQTHMTWVELPPSLPKLIDLHNIESELLMRTSASEKFSFRSLLRRIDGIKLNRQEHDSFANVDRIVVTSDREKNILNSRGSGLPVTVVPNGVDIKMFDNPITSSGQNFPGIVYIGANHYYPNEEAILYFHRKIWSGLRNRMPDITWGIIGGHPGRKITELADDRVRVIGRVPDVVPYLKNAKLMIVPMLSGSGTRIKILESVAAGTPVVSTSLGCEGLPFKDKQHMLVADTPEAFLDACIDTISDPRSAFERATRARELLIRNGYDWKDIGDRFVRILEGLVTA